MKLKYYEILAPIEMLEQEINPNFYSFVGEGEK